MFFIFVYNKFLIINNLKSIIMAGRTKGRVVLTKNPKDNLDAAKSIYDKHVALGTASPLNILQDVNWATTGPKIAPAIADHTAAEFHKGESEKFYANRDKEVPEIKDALKKSVALLKASFGNNPKQLSDWGISVDDSPRVKKPKA
jgi:hypothetical protein